jgi:hypothetical protein
MRYNEILSELQEVNLKEKFISKFEDYVNLELLDMIKKTDKIKSTASLIRTLLKKWENESEEWLYWQKALFYFMTPRFARDKNNLPK